MQTTVTINNLIANTNCSAFSNKEDCTEKLKETQKAVVAKVAEILDCKEIFKTIFGVENPTEKMLFSALTIYYSTANSAYFESDNMMKMKNVTSCFVENSPDFLTKISNNTENKTNLEIIKNDYLNILTSTSSNLITISKANSQDIVKSNSRNVSIISNNSRTNLYDDYKNGSLVITEDNIAIKKLIDDNTAVLMKIRLGGNLPQEGSVAVNSSKKVNNTIVDSFDLKTQNFHIFSKTCKKKI